MAQEIVYRELHDPVEFQKVMHVEAQVWHVTMEGVVPDSFLHALVYGGSCLIGAELDGELIGFVLGFPARRQDEWVIWSHMAGVLPQYRDRAIGYNLKHAQREWALEAGYKRICWTFDPLQSRNANFNLRKLGATANIYLPNFYGELSDGINVGLPSDRLEVSWALDDDRDKNASGMDILPENCLLRQNGGGEILTQELDPAAPVWFIETPGNIADLKVQDLALAQRWQAALSEAMMRAFDTGFVASDFVARDGRYYYMLKK